MTFTRLVDARKDRIYNTEWRAASDASARSTLSGTHRPVGVGGGFKRPDDAGPYRDDAPDLDFAASIAATHECGMR